MDEGLHWRGSQTRSCCKPAPRRLRKCKIDVACLVPELAMARWMEVASLDSFSVRHEPMTFVPTAENNSLREDQQELAAGLQSLETNVPPRAA